MPRCYLFAFGIIVAFLPVMTAGYADEPKFSSTEQSVLLLKNGRVVQGYVSQSAGGYVVAYPTGRMMVPYSQVKFQATSVDAAYGKLRATLPPGSHEARLALARWSLTNGLYNVARNDVQLVLKADPENDTARRMLTRIDELLDPKRETEPSKKTLEERMLAPEVTSLAGMSPDIAARYVAKVQPILMNSCALACCHGPRAKNAFQLERVHLTAASRRGISERNLAVTLRFLDLKNYDQSPLLVKPRGNHGVRGRVIFRGRGGARQIAVLQSWVRDVSRDSDRTQVADSNRKPYAIPPQRPVNFSGVNRTGRSPVFQTTGARPNYTPTPGLQAAKDRLAKRRVVNSLSRPAEKTGTGDPFDPAEFNRQNAKSTNPSFRPNP